MAASTFPAPMTSNSIEFTGKFAAFYPYNLVSRPNLPPLQKTLCLAVSSPISGIIPNQVLTPLYTPDNGTNALTLGIKYTVEGHVDCLDDTVTWPLCFNPNRALPSPPTITGHHKNQIMVNTIGTLISTKFSPNPRDMGRIQLVLTVEHTLQVSASLHIRYTITPNHLTPFFAWSLNPGRRLCLSGELLMWDASVKSFENFLKKRLSSP
ncbi:hypothetical protein PCANC_26749 [Puccinia coronata f. sp. avenae]|uniref:Uncharacterized protein n=1 Tax=Puccinia coronata f. sp. avenae TaxID=200324 RepID=A0A2N5TW89_9BASI|nr:hypothetical protein PCANC_26749 [Puccinia coronata f. sp. avenae]